MRGRRPGLTSPRGGGGDGGPGAAGGLAAAGIAGLVLLVMRSTLQVRTVPERVLEWMLLFVPLDVFEAGLRRFGFDAKRYALYGTILGALVLLAALGALALRRRWSVGALLGLGMGLWLFVMLVVMPLTSAGPFAVALVNGTTAAVGGYLVVALVYAGVLALFRERLAPPVSVPWIDRATTEQLPGWARRGSAHLLGGAVARSG